MRHRLYIQFRALTTLFLLLQTTLLTAQEAMYVWRHDGTIVEIPLAEIDSVTFIAPDIYSSCPDGNHPHAIDLGLPSGTIWSCCNVGATTPEGYGGYYAWGETKAKSTYDDVSYPYFTGQDRNGDGTIDRNFAVIDIGADIAGTEYDAATIIMGPSWQMPTHEQQDELRQCCTRTWTQWHGVNGTVVTGPNGHHLFLPAAGYRNGYFLYDSGSGGDYWSSTVYPTSSANAYTYTTSAGTWLWNYEFRNYGLSVRGVTGKE